MGRAPYLLIVPLALFAAAMPVAGQGTIPFAERSLSDAGLQQNLGRKNSPASWNLNSLTAAALYWHGDLELARAQLSTAEAGLWTAGARPNPSLALVPQSTTPLRTYEHGTYSANLDIPIETAGKRSLRLEQAGKMVASSEAALATAAWSVRARVRLSLLNLYAARERTALLQKSAQHQKQSFEMLQRRLTAGEAALPELLQTRLLAQQTEIALADAIKLQEESRAAAAAAVGLPFSEFSRAELQLSGFGNLPSTSEGARLSNAATAQRSDLVAARAEHDAAASAIRSELAKRYPDIHLQPGYSYDDRMNKMEFGLSFELPILNQNKGPIAEARGRLAEADARLHAAEARVAGEIDFARVSFHAALAKLERADKLFADGKSGLRAAERLLEAGETDRLSLSTAQVEQDSSAVLRLDALIDAQRALGSLEQATETTIDGWKPSLLRSIKSR